MSIKFVLTDYVEQALSQAAYDKLEDGTFAGRIPQCKGVIAFGATLRECQDELRSTLKDWILVGLKLGHSLPVIAGIDLNRAPQRVDNDQLRRDLIEGYSARRDEDAKINKEWEHITLGDWPS